MLWFLRQRQRRHADLEGVEILFATPVYGLDQRLILEHVQLADLRKELDRLKQSYAKAKEAVVHAWREKGRRRAGMVLNKFIDDVKHRLRSLTPLGPAVRTGSARELAAEAGQVLSDMMDAAGIDDPTDRRLIVADGRLANAVSTQVTTRLRMRTVETEIAKVRADIRTHYQRHGEANDGARTHDFLDIRMWGAPPGENQVDLVNRRVVIPPGQYSAASKTVLGEKTTQGEKTLAFNHFVSIVRRRGPVTTLRLLDFEDAGPERRVDGPCSDNPGGMRAATSDRLPPPVSVLRCVYEQWRRLSAWVANPTVLRDRDPFAVRIEGKSPGDMRAQHDDVWMAFDRDGARETRTISNAGIGLQWSARFATLLADPEDRDMLIDYMRQLGSLVSDAMAKSLRDADASVGDDEPIVAEPARSAPPTNPRRITPPVAERDALGLVTATLHAMRMCILNAQMMTRHLILAFAVHGYTTMGTGYKLSGQRVQRYSHVEDQQRWQEHTMREMLASGAARPLDIKALHDTYGRRTCIVRFVCSTQPGPRYAWPQSVPDARKKRGRGASVLPPLLALTQRLHSIAPWIEDTHWMHHPVLGNVAGTQRLLSLLLERLLGSLRDLEALLTAGDVVPEAVANAFHDFSLSEITRRFVLDVGPATPSPRRIPRILMMMYGQFADDLRLLRRFEEHGRDILVREVLQPRGDEDGPARASLRRSRFDVSVPLPNVPGLSVRSVSRPNLNWKHVFRSLFPALFRTLDAAPVGVPIETYRSRIALDDDL